jgi:hypothetical protein
VSDGQQVTVENKGPSDQMVESPLPILRGEYLEGSGLLTLLREKIVEVSDNEMLSGMASAGDPTCTLT